MFDLKAIYNKYIIKWTKQLFCDSLNNGENHSWDSYPWLLTTIGRRPSEVVKALCLVVGASSSLWRKSVYYNAVCRTTPATLSCFISNKLHVAFRRCKKLLIATNWIKTILLKYTAQQICWSLLLWRSSQGNLKVTGM